LNSLRARALNRVSLRARVAAIAGAIGPAEMAIKGGASAAGSSPAVAGKRASLLDRAGSTSAFLNFMDQHQPVECREDRPVVDPQA
jgi:hypothetical protein